MVPMTKDLELRRKWTFRAHGKQMIFFKKSFESDVHVLTKAFIWALFLPAYPDLSVEIRIGNRYKPDLVQTSASGLPVFWGEAGRVSQKKVRYLVNRFRSTHLVFAKWNMSLGLFEKMVKKETESIRRAAPVELISLPADGDERFIFPDGTIRITFGDVSRLRC
jgi:hypothetical protein